MSKKSFESVTANLDLEVYQLLVREARRADVPVATKARHILNEGLKRELLKQRYGNLSLAEILQEELEESET